MGVRPLIVAARYKLLLLTPFLIILPIAIAFSVTSRTTEYTSESTLWAEASTLFDSLANENQFRSPASNRQSDLTELLNTETFKLAVAERVGFVLGTPQEQRVAMRAVRQGTYVYASGEHLVVIGHTGPDAKMAQAIVAATVEEFRQQYLESSATKAASALEIRRQQLETDQATLDKSNEELSNYLLASGANAASTPRYVELKAAFDLAQAAVNDTKTKIAAITRIANDRSGALDTELRIIDEPRLPDTANPTTKRDLVAIPAAGFLLAVSMAAALYAFLLKTDNSIRIAEDLRSLPGLLLLGSVPDVTQLRRRGWPKNFFRVAVSSLGLR